MTNKVEPTVVYQKAPGTERLLDDETANLTSNGLQFIKNGDENILLVPQPSLTDPNDPLRWPKVKKWVTLLNGIAYAFMGSVTGPIMAAKMIPLYKKFGQPLQRLSYANGATLVCQGVGNLLWMPLAIKLGRRLVYMFSNLLMGIACVWLGLATDSSYTTFIIGRAFLGLFEAPIESIVPTTITDIFFLHDRGEKVSIYGLSVLGGNELGPLISALITQYIGMDWAFYIVAMFIGLSCVTMFFFMPETKYKGVRPATSLDLKHTYSNNNSQSRNIEVQQAQSEGFSKEVSISNTERGSVSPPQKSFLGEFALWRKPDPDVSILKVFLRPFILLSYPTVLWACVIYGMSLGWNVVLGATVAQLFAPQYSFDSQAQGLIFLSPLIGSLIGTWPCGSMSDSVANYFTRRNGGIREPEMRLPTLAIATFLTFFGAVITGLAYHYKTHWIGPIIGFGVLTAGAQMGVSLSMSYALDCHRELSVELMVTVASLKSLIAWIWTWVINDWIIADGMLTVFLVIATVNVIVHPTIILLYYRGKAFRLWIHHKDFLGRAGLR